MEKGRKSVRYGRGKSQKSSYNVDDTTNPYLFSCAAEGGTAESGRREKSAAVKGLNLQEMESIFYSLHR